MSATILIFVLLLGFGPYIECAKILGIFPMAGKSHTYLYNRLMRGLADAGHDVTVISPHKNELPIRNGSFTNVVLSELVEVYERVFEELNLYEIPEYNSIWKTSGAFSAILVLYQKMFSHPKFLNFLKEDHSFDLVIVEHIWSESLLGFSKIYNCPLAVFISLGGVNPWVNEMVGNPMPTSYVPHYLKLGDYSKGMSFLDRFHNLLYYLYDAYHNYYIAFPIHNELLKSVFPNAPQIADVYYNVSLVLLGTHSSLRQATPMAPNIVEIGGFHIDPPKKLPRDLQDFLDNAKEGAIYFSMGTHLKSKDLNEEKKKMFLNVFRKLKLKVIWKFDDDILPGKPDNVLIKKWLPQVDILGHPNIKLFISHSGYSSTLEAVYNGVPALFIPVFADQFNNANDAVRKGYALKLSYGDKNFTEENLYAMILQLLNNPEYTKQAKYLSSLFHDRPMKPLDTAIYWIEYVIRYKGADHLKLAGAKLPWYEYYMVDVLLFILSILATSVFVLFKIFKAFVLRLSKKCKQEKMKQN